MLHTITSASPSTNRKRRVAFIAISAGVAVLVAAVLGVAVNGAFASALAPLTRSLPFSPSADDGLIAEGQVVSLSHDEVPAIAKLDPALRDAMRQAETDAAAESFEFRVTSGWRSPQYQEWLLEEAVEIYGSEHVARQYVATPERSTHVTGDGIDIGPVDAQYWLIEHGADYGICQTYANESWHFELATEPGGVCPEMKADAEG